MACGMVLAFLHTCACGSGNLIGIQASLDGTWMDLLFLAWACCPSQGGGALALPTARTSLSLPLHRHRLDNNSTSSWHALPYHPHPPATFPGMSPSCRHACLLASRAPFPSVYSGSYPSPAAYSCQACVPFQHVFMSHIYSS